MTNKIYTAQELREAANYNDAAYARNPSLYSSAVSKMLRQAADMRERCEATIRMLDNGCHKNDVGILNYILRGDAGKEEI